jgi:ABC-2 type transport system ATP-binding protein
MRPESLQARRRIGWIPSGDRTFYLRISGFENLYFFARLYGFTGRSAATRAESLMRRVGLGDVGKKKVGLYSHGMQKRLAIARGLLADPELLLIDEATHDLDPRGAASIRELVAGQAEKGASVLWATQRIEEIRDFADSVTVLGNGDTRFSGPVPEFLKHAGRRSYVLQLGDGARAPASGPISDGQTVLGHLDEMTAGRFLLRLESEVRLGDAIVAIEESGVAVVSCREQRSDLEDAFRRLTRSSGDG